MRELSVCTCRSHKCTNVYNRSLRSRTLIAVSIEMVSVTFVLCLPVRALLYVLLKPPLLLYAFIKYCVLTIVR